MVYEADTVANKAADCWAVHQPTKLVHVSEQARNLDTTYPRKHLRLSMRGRRQVRPRNCFRHLDS